MADTVWSVALGMGIALVVWNGLDAWMDYHTLGRRMYNLECEAGGLPVNKPDPMTPIRWALGLPMLLCVVMMLWHLVVP